MKTFPNIAKPAHSNKTNSFFEGCALFRVESMKAHQVSEPHLLCTRYYKQKQDQPKICATAVKETPIMSAFDKLNKLQIEKFSSLFNIAYKIAKYGKPYTDFEIDCQLIKKLGVDLGNNYLNANRCKDFIKAICEAMTDAIKHDLHKSNFVSILADGTTDVSNLEQENVCVRYISASSNTPVTMLVGVVDLEHGHADGVIDGIFKALSSVGLTRETLKSTESGPSLVGLNFDGASVMQGKKNGVAGKLMRDYSHVISVWCIAHKLQLSVMDAVKDVDALHKLEATLKGIYKYYHGSPKRRREVKAVAEVLEADLAHIPDLKEVRWVASQSKALQAIKTNLLVITTHLGEAASRSDVYAGCAKKYLKDLCSSSVLKTMFLIMDILKVVADLSKFFQTEDLLIIEVLPKMEAACLRLASLKYHPGENM